MLPAKLIASENGLMGFEPAIEILSSGGSALDAVEIATQIIESYPSDHTVGYGGYPNLLGEVELDASIMEGSSRKAGAVGALRGYRHAISVARAVMERLPHVFLVGDGAARFAKEIGLEPENLLTEEAEETWRLGIDGKMPQGSLAERMLKQLAALAADPEHVTGTVNFIARDREGKLASAVSTSGWAWKYPGRLGDSPVIGAGNYADDRYGAAACTGWGELALRAGTARSVIESLRAGDTLQGACTYAVTELGELTEQSSTLRMHLIALSAGGDHCGASTQEGSNYAAWEEGMECGKLLPRLFVDLSKE